jgi:hypothetical protein
VLRIAVITTTLVTSATHALNAVAATKVKDPAKYARTSDGNGWNRTDMKQAVRVIVSKWHVPGGARKASQVIDCESGWGPRSRNACCSGLLQLNRRYFGGWFRRFNPRRGWKLKHRIYNVRTNLTIGLRLAHAGGWGIWSCG